MRDTDPFTDAASTEAALGNQPQRKRRRSCFMTSFTSEFCRNSQLSKVERYGWEMKDEPGELMHVDKKRLRIDHEYQRSANEVKVTEITKRFSWLALGAIVVVRRGDAYYVVDGQHRVMAAMRRTDIATLPCVVFS
jgi:hypothetical protein